MGASTREKQRGLGAAGRISGERVKGVLRMADRDRDRNVGFEKLFFQSRVRVALENAGEIICSSLVFTERVLALRRPKQRVLEKKGVGLGLLQPCECLLSAIVRIFLVTQRKSRPLPPNAGAVFVGKGDEFFVRTGNSAA